MTTKRTWLMVMSVLVLAAATGCGPRRKPVTERDRKEAVVLVSEAQFAMNLRDWARAEGLFARAVELAPEADFWIGLASNRVRLGNRAGAKDAYQSAFKALEDDIAREGAGAELWLRQANVLALMGRHDESRALLAKAAKRFPNEKRIQTLLDPTQFQKMISAPGFKEIAL